MHYVYLLRSQSRPEATYIARTNDLKKRLSEHSAGKSAHTRKFLPWRLITYVAFVNRQGAEEFEAYLKTGSGRAFANRHLWELHR